MSLLRYALVVVVLALGPACSESNLPTAPTGSAAAAAIAALPSSTPPAVTPEPSAQGPREAAAIAGLSIDPVRVRGGEAAAGTVSLAAPAPSGGTIVTLASSDRDVRPPATITIEAGATTGQFRIPTSEPHADTAVRITATHGDSRLTADITLVLVPPDGRSDSYTVPANGSIVVRAPGVLANDERRTGHDLTAVLLRRPQHGILDFDANGGFTYRTAQGISGEDHFTYRSMDGDTRGNEVTVTLIVLPQPVAGPPSESPAPAPAPTGSQTFAFTGSAQSFVVPDGVTTITIDAYGAGGGGGGTNGAISGGAGGLGGRVQATLSVVPGTTYQVNVGGAGGAIGAGSTLGGGGGGASDVRSAGNTLNNRVVVAGAGGGGGGTGGASAPGAGGAGGGLIGAAGGNNATAVMTGGGGGTGSAGGAAGSGADQGSPGAFGQGGNSTTLGTGGAGGFNGGGAGDVSRSAGGGGGYYGGGGGSFTPGQNTGAGGGGGSSFTVAGATNVTHQQGVRSGNGQVIIRW